MTKLAQDRNGDVIQAFTFANSTTQSVAITETAATVIPTDPSNIVVRIVATSDCYVAMGETATASSMPILGGGTEYFARPAGTSISVIGIDGLLYVTEVN
tara:strand:- start:304 stop:603 length:300 start_codon:yes stop_codon:yes gene_type:complete